MAITPPRHVRARLASARRFVGPAHAGLTIVGAVTLAAIALWGPGIDAHAYWAVDLAHPYRLALSSLDATDAYRYAPPLVYVFGLLHAIPWPVFRLLSLAFEVACLWLLLRRWTLAAVALYPVAFELAYGNVDLPMAVAIAAGFRWPAAWATLVLTKLTPGVGLVWFLARRDWARLAIALAATAAIAGVSLAITPDYWSAWVASLVTGNGLPAPTAQILPFSLALRLAGAAVLVAWGARTDRRWTVAAAAFVALPITWWYGPVLLLAAAPLRPLPARRTRPVPVSGHDEPSASVPAARLTARLASAPAAQR